MSIIHTYLFPDLIFFKYLDQLRLHTYLGKEVHKEKPQVVAAMHFDSHMETLHSLAARLGMPAVAWASPVDVCVHTRCIGQA